MNWTSILLSVCFFVVVFSCQSEEEKAPEVIIKEVVKEIHHRDTVYISKSKSHVHNSPIIDRMRDLDRSFVAAVRSNDEQSFQKLARKSIMYHSPFGRLSYHCNEMILRHNSASAYYYLAKTHTHTVSAVLATEKPIVKAIDYSKDERKLFVLYNIAKACELGFDCGIDFKGKWYTCENINTPDFYLNKMDN